MTNALARITQQKTTPKTRAIEKELFTSASSLETQWVLQPNRFHWKRPLPMAKDAQDKLRLALRRRLATNIKAQRARLGLTQERAAESVGFSLQYEQRIERCIVNVPLDTIARFASAFGVDPGELLALEPKKKG